MRFNEIIKRARERSNLSQEDASKMIEKKYGIRLSASYLSMIESGIRTNITINVLNALLDFYQLPLSAAGSLFYKDLANQNVVAEQKLYYGGYSKDPLETADLPEEAQRVIRDFIEYIIFKYHK